MSWESRESTVPVAGTWRNALVFWSFGRWNSGEGSLGIGIIICSDMQTVRKTGEKFVQDSVLEKYIIQSIVRT